MKKLIFIILFLFSLQSFGQIKITDMTTLTSDPANGWVPIVKGGLNYKVDAINIGRDSVAISSGPSADTLKWYRFGTFSFYKLITRGTGTVISVGTGYGLSGGTITTNGTILVDSATLSGYFLRRKDSASASNPTGYITKKDLDDSLVNFLRVSRALIVDTTGAVNGYEAYIKRTAGQPDTLKFRAATGGSGGSDSLWYIRFQPGITTNAPAVGDSIFKHTMLAGKHKKVYLEGKFLHYDDSVGYEYRGSDTSIIFHPPLPANARVYIEITDSLPTRALALQAPAPPSSLLLDDYTSATGAYSLRLLRAGYSGNAIKVRRSSDNTTQDIGFLPSGYLDTASMKTFVSTGTGFIDTWYDQSGNGFNLTQSTAGNQPEIITSGGTVYRLSGQVSIKFTSANNTNLTNSSISGSSVTDALTVLVSKTNNTSTNQVLAAMGSNAVVFQHGAATGKMRPYYGGIYGDGDNTNTDLQLNLSVYDGGGAANADRDKYYLDGAAVTLASFSGTVPASFSGTGLTLGRLHSPSVVPMDGAISEFILWFNDKSASRTGIENNINTFYSLF